MASRVFYTDNAKCMFTGTECRGPMCLAFNLRKIVCGDGNNSGIAGTCSMVPGERKNGLLSEIMLSEIRDEFKKGMPYALRDKKSSIYSRFHFMPIEIYEAGYEKALELIGGLIEDGIVDYLEERDMFIITDVVEK